MEISKNDIAVRSLDEDQDKEQFVIKRTEIKDIYDFQEAHNPNHPLFDYEDVEQVFETSYFSLTVIDNHANQLAGLFIFNDTPFGVLRKENFPNVGGMWEPWFQERFGESEFDGKDSIWLIYFNVASVYDEEQVKKIFHKVFLSSYTTLNQNNAIMMLFLKTQVGDVLNADGSELSLWQTKIMLEYLFEDIGELSSGDIAVKNDFAAYLNKRIKVFPLIEIREGIQEDHDDLENIFKEQTPDEIVDSYEDFFIAKMIADQNEENKVLVGQVNDKAIGMMALSTDLDINLLANSFELENINNLLKQDYMKAVAYKRKMLNDQKKSEADKEFEALRTEYQMEVDLCKVISQRILLQKIVDDPEKSKVYDFLQNWDKEIKTKASFDKDKATQIVNAILNGFKIKMPNFDKFVGKFPIDQGTSLLTTETDFFLETMQLFGLKEGYMDGAGHFEDWEKKEAQKRAEKEKQKEKIKAKNMKGGGFRTTKKKDKQVEKIKKPTYFDLSPLNTSVEKFKATSLERRSKIRQIVNNHRKDLAAHFVNEDGEPTHLRCFNVNDILPELAKKHEDVKSELDNFPELNEVILPFLVTFGGLQYDEAVEQRVIEDESLQNLLKDDKKKAKKEKKDKKKGDKPVFQSKPVDVAVFRTSLTELFRAIDISYKFDRLMLDYKHASLAKQKEENEPEQEESKEEAKPAVKEIFITETEEKEIVKEIEIYENIHYRPGNKAEQQTEYTLLRDQVYSKNIEDSKESYEKYKEILAEYTDETTLPPIRKEVLNAFCVKLFFIEHAFESRSIDFLLKAFDLFKDKDILVVNQPHSFYESSLLENFSRCKKRMDSLFPDMLFVLHRETLLAQLIKIDFTDKHNLMKSAFLFDKHIDGKEAGVKYALCQQALEQTSKYQVLHAKIEGNIIGIFVISKEANVEYYDSHFNVRDFINIDNILKYYHSRLVFCLLNKNFKNKFKLILKEIGRKANKITFYYEIPHNSYIPTFVNSMYFLRSRKFPQFEVKKKSIRPKTFFDREIKDRTDNKERIPLDNNESEFTVVMNSKNLLSNARIVNNNRIVVVGSSDTGISFIDTLLSLPYSEFTHIFLVSPGGLLYHHIEDEIDNLKVSVNNFKLTELKKLLLEKRVKIINLQVVDINRNDKYVKFDDGSVLLYDYLILTLGLQDSLWKTLSGDIEKEIDAKFDDANAENEQQKNEQAAKEANTKEAKAKTIEQPQIISIDRPEIHDLFAPNSKILNSLRKNKKYEIVLYGRSLNLLTFIQGLLRRGVPPGKINLVIPGLETVGPKDEKIKKENRLPIEELNLLNNNTFETNPEIEDYLIQNIVGEGVKIFNNHKFDSVTLNENKDAIQSFDFVSENESTHPQCLNASLIVTGGMLDIDQKVFNFIHDNGLVYNGRMIIDRQFATADPHIFAAGRLCEFSQRYSFADKGKLLKLERFYSN